MIAKICGLPVADHDLWMADDLPKMEGARGHKVVLDRINRLLAARAQQGRRDRSSGRTRLQHLSALGSRYETLSCSSLRRDRPYL
jgi:hypothetical protein